MSYILEKNFLCNLGKLLKKVFFSRMFSYEKCQSLSICPLKSSKNTFFFKSFFMKLNIFSHIFALMIIKTENSLKPKWSIENRLDDLLKRFEH